MTVVLIQPIAREERLPFGIREGEPRGDIARVLLNGPVSYRRVMSSLFAIKRGLA